VRRAKRRARLCAHSILVPTQRLAPGFLQWPVEASAASISLISLDASLSNTRGPCTMPKARADRFERLVRIVTALEHEAGLNQAQRYGSSYQRRP